VPGPGTALIPARIFSGETLDRLVKPACPAAVPHKWGRKADDIG
jgi:hypothetical protein